MRNTSYAPWPSDLAAAVEDLRYMEGWRFSLEVIDRDFSDVARTEPIAGGLTFIIFVPCYDAYHPEQYRPVHHYHPVPAATFNRASWERWLVDRLLDTIRHEACEHFRFEREVAMDLIDGPGTRLDVRRPFAPTHGPGDDPYALHEYASDEQRRTSFRGEVKVP